MTSDHEPTINVNPIIPAIGDVQTAQWEIGINTAEVSLISNDFGKENHPHMGVVRGARAHGPTQSANILKGFGPHIND